MGRENSPGSPSGALRQARGARTILITTLAVLLLAGALLFAAGFPSTQGRFYLDSDGYFRSLPYFQERSLSWPKIRGAIFENPYPGGKRWIPNLTFLVENRLVGLTPASGRVVGLLIHLINIFLVFALLRGVLLLTGREEGSSTTAAMLGALFWGLNPFHCETVFYVIQRMTLLYATFYLAAVLLYLRWRRTAGPGRWKWMILAVLAVLASILSKESGVLVILGIAVLEMVIRIHPSESGPSKLSKPGGGSPGGRSFGAPAIVAVLFIVFVGIMFLLLGYDPAEVVRGILSAGPSREFTTVERFLTQGRVLVDYLGILFFPAPSRFSLVMKYHLSRSLLSPPWTLAAWALVVGLVVLALGKRRVWPLFSLAVLWFFANHLLESTFLNLEIAFAHRNYLPSVFLFLPAAAWLAEGPGRARPWLRWGASAAVLAFFLLGVNARARAWGDPVAFWKDVIAKSPGSLRGYINLGVLYDIQGRKREALDVYQAGSKAAFEEKPAFQGDLYCNTAMALMDLGRPREAEPYLERALSIAPNEDYLYNMARLQRMLGDPEKGVKALSTLEARNPLYPDLHLMKARFLLDGGNRVGARRELAEELRLYPNNLDARGLLAAIGAN